MRVGLRSRYSDGSSKEVKMRRCLGMLVVIACLCGHTLSPLDAGGKHKRKYDSNCAAPYPSCAGCAGCATPYSNCAGCAGPAIDYAPYVYAPRVGCAVPNCAGFGCAQPVCSQPACGYPLNYGCASSCAVSDCASSCGYSVRPEYAPYVYAPRSREPCCRTTINRWHPCRQRFPACPPQKTWPGSFSRR